MKNSVALFSVTSLLAGCATPSTGANHAGLAETATDSVGENREEPDTSLDKYSMAEELAILSGTLAADEATDQVSLGGLWRCVLMKQRSISGKWRSLLKEFSVAGWSEIVVTGSRVTVPWGLTDTR